MERDNKRCMQLLLLLMLVSIEISCSSKISMKEGDTLNRNEGILLMNLIYKEGIRTYESIVLTIESVDKLFFTKIKLTRNTSKLVILRLKADSYVLSDVHAVGDTSYATPDRRQDEQNFYGKMYENVFTIRPNVTNYIGDILIQTNRERLGKHFNLTTDTGVNLRTYFLVSIRKSTIKSYSKKYKELVARYPILETNLYIGIESISKKELYRKAKRDREYGYGGQTYGEDLKGYDKYKWRTDFEKLKISIQKDFVGFVLDIKDKLISIIGAVENDVITFYVDKDSHPKWENKLYKVTVSTASSVKDVVNKLSKLYGVPQKVLYSYVWELPSTIIRVSKASKGVRISYESKLYLEDTS